ncbi:helix-turn-helix transcriptional regulator [Paenibacillus sp. NPDC056933]|uniref:helix-turn-helix transcriptional regulator n=1 Tax=Paenibacillus sp. NPDC056933 TaxID=3345968 RepID=UPI0036395F30
MRNRIKALREQKNISQGKLAEQCDVSRQTINAIENDKYDPSLPLAFAISEVLEVTIEQLFIYERKKP